MKSNSSLFNVENLVGEKHWGVWGQEEYLSDWKDELLRALVSWFWHNCKVFLGFNDSLNFSVGCLFHTVSHAFLFLHLSYFSTGLHPFLCILWLLLIIIILKRTGSLLGSRNKHTLVMLKFMKANFIQKTKMGWIVGLIFRRLCVLHILYLVHSSQFKTYLFFYTNLLISLLILGFCMSNLWWEWWSCIWILSEMFWWRTYTC